MIRYSRQLISFSDIKTVNQVLKSDFLTQGPKSILFEKKLSSKFNVKYSTSCNSATSALHLACLALGVKKEITFGLALIHLLLAQVVRCTVEQKSIL